MKERVKHNAFLIGLVTVIVALDQWTKLLVTHKLAIGESISPIAFLADFFQIVNWHNTGAAFGLFQNANVVLLIVSLLIGIIVLFYYQMIKPKDWLAKASLALIFAGAIGNIIDRIKFGYVIDFLAFGRFPVFNVADSAVTIGVFLMLFHFFNEDQKAKKTNAETSEQEDSKSSATEKELEEVALKVEDDE